MSTETRKRDEAFQAIETRLMSAYCTLSCVSAAIERSEASDGDEDISRASIVLHDLVDALNTLHNDLDRFSAEYLRAKQIAAFRRLQAVQS